MGKAGHNGKGRVKIVNGVSGWLSDKYDDNFRAVQVKKIRDKPVDAGYQGIIPAVSSFLETDHSTC